MLARHLEDAISVDEVGLSTAAVGGAVIRTAFQPVYQVRDDGRALIPVAVEGLAVPFREGEPVALPTLLATLDSQERCDAERICVALHCRNLLHVGGETQPAHLVALGASAFDSGRMRDDLLEEISASMQVGSLVRLGFPQGSSKTVRMNAVAALRSARLSVITELDAGLDDPALLHPKHSDIVQIDGRWLRHIPARSAGHRMFAQLVGRLHEEGLRVLARDLQTPATLKGALALGCDLVQGDAISPFIPAGHHMELQEIFIGGDRWDDGKVVALLRPNPPMQRIE